MSLVPTKLLKAHPKNLSYYNNLTGEKYEELKRSIQVHGIRDPLKVLPDYTVIAGHQRLIIAIELGMEKVPVTILDLSSEEAEYLLIADNEERRQGDDDPMKVARRAKFLKEYWDIKRISGRERLKGQNVPSKTINDIANTIGEDERTTKRLLKLNDLILPLQNLVSVGKLNKTAGEQLAYLSEDVQQTLWETLGEEIGSKTVAEVKEIRQKLEAAQIARAQAEAEIKRLTEDNATLRQANKELSLIKKQEPKEKIIEKEVVPQGIREQLDKLQKENWELSEKKKQLENELNSEDRELEKLKIKHEKLKYQAHINIFELQILTEEYLKKASPYLFLQAIKLADAGILKEKLLDTVESLEEFAIKLREIVTNKHQIVHIRDYSQEINIVKEENENGNPLPVLR